MGLGSVIKRIGTTLGRGLSKYATLVAPHIGTALGVWNGLKDNITPIGKLSNNIGNWLQNKTASKEGDGWIKQIVKGIGGGLNQMLFDPTNKTSENTSPPHVQVSKNSSNATWTGGEGMVYGTHPNIKQNYQPSRSDFVRTDFENFQRRMRPSTIGSSHKYVSGADTIRGARRYAWY